ncbi:hypothetical protein KAU08_04530 [bacterium]|nr:hypothetical protein [bacterium]
MLQDSFRIYLILMLLILLGCDRGGNILMVGGVKGPVEVPEGSTVEFSVEAEGDSGITYNWVVNPVGFGTLGTPTSASTTFTAPEVDSDFEIVIRVVVNSDNDGPVVRSLDVIVKDVADPPDPPVNQPPTAAAHVDYNEISAGDSLQFYDDSTDPDGDDDIVLWEWDFSYDPDDGFNIESSEMEPLVEFPEFGIFDVQLCVTDSAGLSDMLDEPLELTVLHEHPVATYGFTIGGDGTDHVKGIRTDSDGNVYLCGWVSSSSLDLDPGDVIYELDTTEENAFVCKYAPSDFHVIDAENWGPARRLDSFSGDGTETFFITGFIYDHNYNYPFSHFNGPFIRSITPDNLNLWEIRKYSWDWYSPLLNLDTWEHHYFSNITKGIDGAIYYIYCANAYNDSTSWSINKILKGETDYPEPDFDTFLTFPSKIWRGYSICATGNGILVLIDVAGEPLHLLHHYSLSGILEWELPVILKNSLDYPSICATAQGNYIVARINDNAVSLVSPDGDFIWELFWDAEVTDIYVYDDDSFLVSGFFTETVDFDPGPGEAFESSSDKNSGYVSYYDSDGNFQWVETWGNSESYTLVKGVCVDHLGNIYVCGEFVGSIDLGPPWASDIHYSNCGYDAFVLKLSRTPQQSVN